MRARLFVCAIGCAMTAPLPASAEEADTATIRADALAMLHVERVPGRERSAPERLLSASKPARFTLPVASARLAPRPLALRFTRRDEPRQPEPGDETAFAAARDDMAAGTASRAVRDALADHPKPRIPRSPLSTALVLRLDGDRASPPISVGGGGVAGAVWGMLPGR